MYMGVYNMQDLDGDTTIRLKLKTKDLLDNLDFVKKGTTYNEILEKLVVEYRERFRNA